MVQRRGALKSLKYVMQATKLIMWKLPHQQMQLLQQINCKRKKKNKEEGDLKEIYSLEEIYDESIKCNT